MIQIEENQSFSEDYVNKLINDELAYVTAEIRLLLIAMNICQKKSDAQLYLASEKTYATPRALGLSKYTIDSNLKKQINTDISNIQSSGLFAFWMNNAMNRTLLKCIHNSEEENHNKDFSKIVITMSLLRTLFIFFVYLLCFSIFIFVLEIAHKHLLKYSKYSCFRNWFYYCFKNNEKE